MSGSVGQVQVSPADLVSHARKINRIGDGLTMAQQAGAAARMDSRAYGMLCQIVPALLDALQDKAIDGIAAAATSAHDTADAIRATAADYDGSDNRAATRMRNIR
jgi:Excreted virulence factor EspC, type VII ESX diderm